MIEPRMAQLSDMDEIRDTVHALDAALSLQRKARRGGECYLVICEPHDRIEDGEQVVLAGERVEAILRDQVAHHQKRLSELGVLDDRPMIEEAVEAPPTYAAAEEGPTRRDEPLHSADCPWDKTRMMLQRRCTCGVVDDGRTPL